MWKVRKEEEPLPPTARDTTMRPVSTPPAPAPNARAEVQKTEAARPQAFRGSEMANIGKSVVIKGELSGSEDLIVDGRVEGTIELNGNSLTVGPNGHIKAHVQAKDVIIQGKVDGNVTAKDRVELRQTAVLVGDITTARIIIEEGAYFKGAIDVQREGRTEAKQQAAGAVK